MRSGLIGLASAVLLGSLAAPLQAQDVRRYAEREAETPGLADFKGGCHGPNGWALVLLVPLAIVALPFYLLYKGGEALYKWICPPYEKKEPDPCAPPRS